MVHTKIQVYRACVVSTLLCGSESWTLRSRQERKLDVFHLRFLRRILNITWQGKVPNKHNPGLGWNFQHVHSSEAATPSLSWACCENGRWLDLKGSPLQRTSTGKAPHSQIAAALQGLSQLDETLALKKRQRDKEGRPEAREPHQ